MIMRISLLILLAIEGIHASNIPTAAPTHSLVPTSPTLPPTPLPTANDNQYVFATELYHATNGPNWKSKTNWMVGEPCDDGAEWYGFTCGPTDISGRLKIGRLQLNGNRYLFLSHFAQHNVLFFSSFSFPLICSLIYVDIHILNMK